MQNIPLIPWLVIVVAKARFFYGVAHNETVQRSIAQTVCVIYRFFHSIFQQKFRRLESRFGGFPTNEIKDMQSSHLLSRGVNCRVGTVPIKRNDAETLLGITQKTCNLMPFLIDQNLPGTYA